MNKLLIIDGSALLFQSFFGMPNKIVNSKGENVEAVICFIGILLKTIKMLNPNQLLIVFDGENKLERQEVDIHYKANRPDYSQAAEQDNPFIQLETIKLVLNYLNFKWVETINCEADDLIASIVNDKKDLEIVISSSDKDFYQLINENVSVFTYRGKVSKLITEQVILNQYGFSANLFSTFKSIVGDKSDNISGIAGVGEKTASSLIKTYGNLTQILANINNVNEKLKLKLIENKQKLLTNYKLVELHSKTNLFALPNCKFKNVEKSSTAILKEINII